MACNSASGVTIPPAPLWVFSAQTRLARGAWTDAGRIVARKASAVSTGPPRTARTCSPASAAVPAISQFTMCESSWQKTSVPGSPRSQSAAWFAIVPVGK